MLLLIDTNVWIDNYIPNRPNYRTVGDLLRLALTQGHELLYAVPAIKDVFYLIGHAYKESAREQGGIGRAHV